MILRTLARRLEPVVGDAPPTEFLLFAPGVNETQKGPVLFDAAAAASVMATYSVEGVDLMIDLEHQSIYCPEARPDCSDARGWARVELRADGSLWAVDVRWTPDGARRLLEKTQRYTSPAFLHDKEGRVTKLVNCSIVARPATYDAAPLVAASKAELAQPATHSTPALVAASRASLARAPRAATLSKSKMDPKDIQSAIDAIKKGDANAALDLLEKILVGAAGGTSEPSSPDNAAPDAPTAETADAPVAAALSAVAEARATLTTLTAEVASLTATRNAAENAARVALVGDLVKLGAETPATAYASEGVLCSRLASEPVEAMRSRVTVLRAANPTREIKAPTTDAPDVSTLSKDELARCKKAGIEPADYIARKAAVVRRVG